MSLAFNPLSSFSPFVAAGSSLFTLAPALSQALGVSAEATSEELQRAIGPLLSNPTILCRLSGKQFDALSDLAAAGPEQVVALLSALVQARGEATMMAAGRLLKAPLPQTGPLLGPPLAPLKVVLIPNRGDPAIRAIRAVRDFNRRYGTDIKVAVTHSAVDGRDDFVRMADLAIEIPPARVAEKILIDALELSAEVVAAASGLERCKREVRTTLEEGAMRDPAFRELYLDVSRSVEEAKDAAAIQTILRGAVDKAQKPVTSYQNIPEIIQAARRLQERGLAGSMREIGIIPGWGFLSERGDFVAAVEREGMTFVGPTSEQMDQMGHKLNGLKAMKGFGVPTGEFSEQIDSPDEAVRVAQERFGFPERPVMVKYSLGGGGTGNKLARTEKELRDIVTTFQRQGKTELFIEEFMGGEGVAVNHLEFQVVGDGQGKVVVLGWRQCSEQRRNQKVFEKTATNVSLEVLERIKQDLIRALSARRWRGASTAEFLVARGPDGEEKAKFMEMNTRLQVEHGITEESYGVDLMGEMLRVSMGLPLSVRQEDVRQRAVSIEARVLAEDRDFVPQTGRIEAIRFPGGPGVRVDSAVSAGSVVTPHFDSMIAKLIVSAPMGSYDPANLASYKRALDEAYREAVARLRRALLEFKILGIESNLELLREVAGTEEFARNGVHLGFLGGYVEGHKVPERPHWDLAIAAATTKAYLREMKGVRDLFFSERVADSDSSLPSSDGLAFTVVKDGGPIRVVVQEAGPGRMAVSLQGRSLTLEFAHVDDHTYRVTFDSTLFETLIDDQGDRFRIEIDGKSYPLQVSRGQLQVDRSLITSRLSGNFWKNCVTVGQRVQKGDVICVLESMKSEIAVEAPHDGVVKEVRYNPDWQHNELIPIQRGDPLYRIEPDVREEVVAVPEIPLSSFPQPGGLERLRLADADHEGAIAQEIFEERERYLPAILHDIQRYLLGYDYPINYIDRLTTIVERIAREAPSAFHFTSTRETLSSFLQIVAGLKTLFGSQFRNEFYAMRRGGLRGGADGRELRGVMERSPEFRSFLLDMVCHYGFPVKGFADLDRNLLANLLIRVRLAERNAAVRDAIVTRLIPVAGRHAPGCGETLARLIGAARSPDDRALRKAAEGALRLADFERYRRIRRAPLARKYEDAYAAFQRDVFSAVPIEEIATMKRVAVEGRPSDLAGGLPTPVEDFIRQMAEGRGFTYRRLYTPYHRNFLFEATSPEGVSLIAVSYNEGEVRFETDPRGEVRGAPLLEELSIQGARAIHMYRRIQEELRGQGAVPEAPYKGNEVYVLSSEQYPLEGERFGEGHGKLSARAVREIGENALMFFHGAEILATYVVLPFRQRKVVGRKVIRMNASTTGLTVREIDPASLFRREGKPTARQHLRGLMTAEERFTAFFDEGSWRPLTIEGADGRLFRGPRGREIPPTVHVAMGNVGGLPVYAYACDFRVAGGAFGEGEGLKQVALALMSYGGRRLPIVGLMDGAGANIEQGLVSLNWSAEDFMMKVITGGRADRELFLRHILHHPDRKVFRQLIERYGGGSPQTAGRLRADRRFQDLVRHYGYQAFAVSDQVGAGIGMVVYGSSLLPLQIMVNMEEVYRNLTGERVRQVAMGEEGSNYQTGGAPVHSRLSGEVHAVTATEPESFQMVARLLQIFHPDARKIRSSIERVPVEEADASCPMAAVVRARQNLDGALSWPFMAELQEGESVAAGFGRLAGIPVAVAWASEETGFGTYPALFKVREMMRSAAALRAPVIKVMGKGWIDPQRSDDPRAMTTRDELLSTSSEGGNPQFSVVLNIEGTRALGAHHGSDRKFFVNSDSLGDDELARLKRAGFEVVPTIEEAFDQIARTLAYFERDERGLPLPTETDDPIDRPTTKAAELILPQMEKTYDTREVIRDYADRGSFQEIWGDQNDLMEGPSLVVGLARIGGKPHMVIADQPSIRGGTPDAMGAAKYRRAVMLAARRKIPIVVLADAPGFDPSAMQEALNIQGEGAESIEANILSTVPVVTVNVRKGYGGRFIQSMHKFLRPGIRYLVVKGSEIAVMGPGGAEAVFNEELGRVRREHPKEFRGALNAAMERRRGEGYGDPQMAVDTGAADEMIEKTELRQAIFRELEVAEVLAETAFERGYNIVGTGERDVFAAMQRLETLGFEVEGIGTPRQGEWIRIADGDWRAVVLAQPLLLLLESFPPGTTKEEVRTLLASYGSRSPSAPREVEAAVGEVVVINDETMAVAEARGLFMGALRAVGVTISVAPDGALLLGGETLTEGNMVEFLEARFAVNSVLRMAELARRGKVVKRVAG